MPHPFNSIALIGNTKDLRVAECMLSLAAHFNVARRARHGRSRDRPQVPAG